MRKYCSLPALTDQFPLSHWWVFLPLLHNNTVAGAFIGAQMAPVDEGHCRQPACVDIEAQGCRFVLWQAKLRRSEVLRLPFCPAVLYDTAFPLWCFSRYWIDSTLIGPRQYKCNLIRSLRIAESTVWTPQHAHGLFLIWFSYNFMHKGNELQIVM